MLIYDRRRCSPLAHAELRARLTIAQRAKLGYLEAGGWQLVFLRGQAAMAFVEHAEHGHAAIARDGRVVAVRSLTRRQGDLAADETDGLARAVEAQVSRTDPWDPLPAERRAG